MARLSRRGQERGVRELRQVATWLARNADHSARVKLRTGPPGSRLSRMPTESPGSPATSTQVPLEKLKELLPQRAFNCSLLIAGCCLGPVAAPMPGRRRPSRLRRSQMSSINLDLDRIRSKTRE